MQLLDPKLGVCVLLLLMSWFDDASDALMFLCRFLNNKFSDSYTPTIENFYRKVYRIRGEIYQLDILDTSGNQYVLFCFTHTKNGSTKFRSKFIIPFYGFRLFAALTY